MPPPDVDQIEKEPSKTKATKATLTTRPHRTSMDKRKKDALHFPWQRQPMSHLLRAAPSMQNEPFTIADYDMKKTRLC